MSRILALLLLLILLFALLAACLPMPVPATATREPSSATASSPCGDGRCRGPENARNCPADCGTLPQPTAAPSPAATQGEAPVVCLGIMVHLEGWDDDRDRDRFQQHARLIREYAELFEAHGARLTLESKEVTDGCLRWGDNVLLEMQQRGHGIGVHADIGGERNYDCSRFAADLRQERLQLESLGVTVRHVSGNTSHCDWVAATVEAGYLFTTGQVAYSVMSMPLEQRPPEYRDCRSPALCHQVFPPDLADRLHPWRAASGTDWLTHDPDGPLVILAASQGLPCMQEELTGRGTQGGCEFTAEDIDYFFQELEQAIALAEADQINIFYVSWSLGRPLDKELLEKWLGRVEPYVQAGQVEWKTLPEMYDAYVQWERNQ